MSDPEFVEKDDPGEVFSVLSDETRVAILQALWEADNNVATFSELREAVGTRDSGRFNYHLDKLVGRFIRKTDEGYKLTQAGREINGAIASGAYTMDATIEPIELTDSCPTCGRSITFTYDDERVQVTCESCFFNTEYGVPPSAFAGYERAEIPAVASRHLRTTIHRLVNGFCGYCDGRMEGRIGDFLEIVGEPTADESPLQPAELDVDLSRIPWAEFECARCDSRALIGVDLLLLEHPAVAGFFYEHGIDVRDEPLWEYATMDTDRVFIRNEDPFRAAVTYRSGGDSLTVVVNEDFEVVSIEE